MKKATQFMLMLACAITFLMAPRLWAQEEQAPPVLGQVPPPAAEEPSPTSDLVPDSRPLSGAEDLRVETPGRSRDYVIPSLRLATFGDTNRTLLTTGQRVLEMTGSIVGGLEVHRASRKSDFVLDYQGGGVFYARNSELNATMHQLSITERYTGRRWGLTLGDQMSYLPESSFGFGGFGGSLGLGGSGSSWNPAFLPDQSVFSGGGERIFNSALVQVEYLASARSVLSFAGTYGILRFKEPGFVESNSTYATAGYNYSVTRRDTVSLNYGFGAMRFIGSDFHLDNHFFSFAYGRHLTGKLAFSVSGGPQIIIRRSPAFGTETSTDLFARTRMDYKMGRNNLNWSYAHYTSNGSGIFLGAKTDRVRMTYSRRLTRNWSWSLGPGYARNARLTNGLAVTDDTLFNSIFGHSSLSRNLGRYTSLGFSYNIHRQWSDTTGPAGTIRSSSYMRHFFGVSLTWHARRIGLD